MLLARTRSTTSAVFVKMFKKIEQARLLMVSLIKKISPPIYYYTKNAVHIYSIHSEMIKELRSPSIVLVYSMGKVGSSSVFESLKATIDQPIYQIHSLNIEDTKKFWKKIKLHQSYFNRDCIDREKIVSRFLSYRFSRILGQKNLKIISIVRDPVSRNISHFFENIDMYFRDFKKRLNLEDIEMKDLVNVFWEREYVIEKHIDWFDREFKSVLGLDIFSTEVSRDKGYTIIRDIDRKLDVLLLKMESFDRCLENALAEFLGVEQVIIKKVNIAQSKYYFSIYNNFKNHVNFTQEYLEEIYTQKLVTHLYTKGEIDNFKSKWLHQESMNS
jgi:hypothetical protein